MKFQTWSVVKNYDAVDADARILDNGVEAELESDPLFIGQIQS